MLFSLSSNMTIIGMPTSHNYACQQKCNDRKLSRGLLAYMCGLRLSLVTGDCMALIRSNLIFYEIQLLDVSKHGG